MLNESSVATTVMEPATESSSLVQARCDDHRRLTAALQTYLAGRDLDGSFSRSRVMNEPFP